MYRGAPPYISYSYIVAYMVTLASSITFPPSQKNFVFLRRMFTYEVVDVVALVDVWVDRFLLLHVDELVGVVHCVEVVLYQQRGKNVGGWREGGDGLLLALPSGY